MEIIIALDFKDLNETKCFLSNFGNEVLYVKVGMELYYEEGKKIIKYLKSQNYKIFLDLKLHDIPETVKKTMQILGKLEVDMINIHATGSKKMMCYAKEGLKDFVKKPLLIGVTQLTSTEESYALEVGLCESVDLNVLRLAQNCIDVFLDGVVCSVKDVKNIKKMNKEFLCITPGIRNNDDNKDDQIRISTAKDAYLAGSDFIVVGRSITKSLNPLKTYLKMKEEIYDC